MVVVAEWFVRGFVMRPLSECGCFQSVVVVGVRLFSECGLFGAEWLLSECGFLRVWLRSLSQSGGCQSVGCQSEMWLFRVVVVVSDCCWSAVVVREL